MQPLVSVVVPVYKVEKYLKKSVNSILRQTYDALEILLIDDGSPDNCPAMCDEFERKDDRVRVFHIENGGVSNARNVGIEAATGKYIMFVDSDDWMQKNAVERLVFKIESDASDFCHGVVEQVSALKTLKVNNITKTSIEKGDKKQLYKFVEEVTVGPWAKLYRRDLIEKNSLRFPEDIRYAEDRIFLWKYLRVCNKFSATNSVVYYYNKLVGNAATSKHYENIHNWLLMDCDELCSFLVCCKNKDINNSFVAEYVLINFFLAMTDHTLGSSVAIAVESIKATYLLFKKYIDSVYFKYANFVDYATKMTLSEYVSYLEQGNYMELYKEISGRLKTAQRNTVLLKIREFLIAVKTFIIFGQ